MMVSTHLTRTHHSQWLGSSQVKVENNILRNHQLVFVVFPIQNIALPHPERPPFAHRPPALQVALLPIPANRDTGILLMHPYYQ